MSWQSLLSIIGACVGVTAGIWLCFGAALITPERIAEMDDNSWKADPDVAGALTSQSGEYLAGGVLLIFSFLLQMGAMLVPEARVQVPCAALLNIFLILASLLGSFVLAIPIYKCRKKYLQLRLAQLKLRSKINQ
jgi:ABC-type antimicrobial peptide transport system permease subunit